MPTKSKSSASSATRKKHARKAAGPAELPLPKEKKPKDKTKGKSKEPRQKIYIQPSKPAPVQPDPLDSLGIAKQLPPDLVVTLRLLTKKDLLTKRRGIEDLRNDWVERCLADKDVGGIAEAALVTALPVWTHHLPSLLLSPSRPIRLSAATLHLSLLQVPVLLEQILYIMTESGSTSQIESVLGSWCLATQDIDRQVSCISQRSWDLFIRTVPPTKPLPNCLTLDASHFELLTGFAEHATLDPAGLHATLNPVQPAFVPNPLPGPRKGAVRQAPSTPTRRVDDDASMRVRPEDEEENDSDRKGRLRCAALGVFKWIIETKTVALPHALSEILGKSALWSGLYHGDTAPFCEEDECFGSGQVVVRKGTWLLLYSLLKSRTEEVMRILPLLSSAVLRSAWVEPDATVRAIMWEPLLTFLTRYPKAWELDRARPVQTATRKEESEDNDSDDDDSGSEVQDDDDKPVDGDEVERAPTPTPPPQMTAYHEFLQFLQLGCSGSPAQGYPTVVIIVSTIPPSLLGQPEESWADFFTSFWAALDGRALSALDRGATSAAFLTSLLECLVFLVKRARTPVDTPGDGFRGGLLAVRHGVEQQIVRTLEELAARRLRLEGSIAGRLVAGTLQSLDAINADLFHAAWVPFSNATKEAFRSPKMTDTDLLVTVLKVFNDLFKEGSAPKRHLRDLITQSAVVAIVQCETLLQLTDIGTATCNALPVTDLIDKFGQILLENGDIKNRLDGLLQDNMSAILLRGPSLLTTYLKQRNDATWCTALWCRALQAVASDSNVGEAGLRALLDGVEIVTLPGYLKPEEAELDKLAKQLLADSLSGGEESKLSTMRRLLKNPEHLLSPSSADALLHDIVFAFSEKTRRLLHDSHAKDSPSKLHVPLDLINAVLQARPEVASGEDLRTFLPDFFIFGFLFPHSVDFADTSDATLDTTFALARQIWKTCVLILKYTADAMEELSASLKGVLRDIITDTDSRPTPHVVLQTVSGGQLGFDVDPLSEIFPSKDQLEDVLAALAPNPVSETLAIIEPLAPPPSVWVELSIVGSTSYDTDGLSEYARIINGLLFVCTNDRQLARSNPWLLRHLLILASSANELLQVPHANSAIFRPQILDAFLRDIIASVQKVSAFVLSTAKESVWHTAVVNAILHQGSKAAPPDSVGQLVVDLMEKAREKDNYREALVLRTVLQHVLSEATKEDADQWMLVARKIESQAPQTSLTITLAVTEFAPEPPRLYRYRNELAAGSLGIPPAKANKDGLLLLRRLAATAPDPESDIIFLSQLRAVNFVKACQQWITSDEDLNADIESAMTFIFFYLAPILQNVTGSHWDLIFDIIDNNFENCSFAAEATLVLLYRTLKLLVAIQDLVSSNKALRALWKERETNTLTLVRDLVSKPAAIARASVPRALCWELALSVVQELPLSLIDHNTLPSMCHLLLDPSPDIQKMAYTLLQQAANKRTEHLVVEAGVDTTGEVKFELPAELLDVLARSLEQTEDKMTEPNPFGYLLTWMIIFDLFNDASLKVKMGYAEQLRNLDLVATSFLPNIWGLLDLYGGRSKAFSLDIWAVEEYYLQLYEPDSPLSLKLLAAHLYYRALLCVPSLIATWWSECKDKQLASAVSGLTTRHYSPVLVAAELAHLKDPAAAAELAGENWSMRVASAASEVALRYLVDDQQMEMGIRLPRDYPLHGIEVRDIHKVGVEEERWRGWLFAVHQVVSTKNGRIVDGLSIFKKNVTHHFQNQTECAICYSIVSVTELSLPKKSCKTCKNRFHASCLFKWFSTSHTSSCPLCRSDFI